MDNDYSIVQRMGGSGFGFGSGEILIGGNRLILRPCLPVFRCQRPDRGRLPNSRLRFGEPIGVLACSIFDTRP